MAGPRGFEPPIFALGGRCFSLLAECLQSYPDWATGLILKGNCMII
ncbi:MAG: hypothetical protein KAT57_03200 [Candidatus Lokiarchaeota archaeon]|nr:hypothetical protein [Candidatus Lokiarchaeota archaeon]MCK4480979.1 hypothetical protein [Candidatus Lokiarchaeota archaeon]MCK4779163.1 hypothetical protein [Candidatus Lokiarchaeota archaeon]